jgi:PhnB protein
MTTTLNPYLNFLDGKAREAMEFYQSILGGDLKVMTFGDMGMEGDVGSQVMHAQLQTDAGFTLMGADAPEGMVQVTVGNNVSVSISGDELDLLQGYFEKLSDGGTVTMPLDKQAWGDVFGACVDKYGINWLVDIYETPAEGAAAGV